MIQTEINGMLQFEVQRARDPITDKNLMTRVVGKEKRVCTERVYSFVFARKPLIGWELRLRMDFGVIESAVLHISLIISQKEIKQRFFFIFSQLHLLKIVYTRQAKKSFRTS